MKLYAARVTILSETQVKDTRWNGYVSLYFRTEYGTLAFNGILIRNDNNEISFRLPRIQSLASGRQVNVYDGLASDKLGGWSCKLYKQVTIFAGNEPGTWIITKEGIKRDGSNES